VGVQPNSNARWLPPWFRIPASGKNVFSHLIFFLAAVERMAVVARHASPGTGQEGPLLAMAGRREREGQVGQQFFLPPLIPRLSPNPLLETLAARSFLGFLVGGRRQKGAEVEG
jgi:hypothetical protein